MFGKHKTLDYLSLAKEYDELLQAQEELRKKYLCWQQTEGEWQIVIPIEVYNQMQKNAQQIELLHGILRKNRLLALKVALHKLQK